MVGAQRLGRDDARVGGNFKFGLVEGVLVRGHEEALVVGAAVAQHDLGRVFVGHDH